AAFRSNRDAQGIAREDDVERHRRLLRRQAGLTRLARAVNLQHGLRRAEAPCRTHFFEQGFDVGAQEFERLLAGLADEMKVTRMPVGMLEPNPAVAEVHSAGDA